MPKPSDSSLGFPELIEPNPGSWEKFEVDIQESAVDTKNRKAFVPRARTPAQRLARFHEWGHVKYSPRDWDRRIENVCRAASKPLDRNAVHKIQKMLEENRIDWLLWSRHGIDLRPAREVLDWAKMPDPPHALSALGNCLQLAWTVWASRGLGGKTAIPNPPPTRAVDPDTAEFFDRCWTILTEENNPLARSMIRGCMRMYTDPTHEMRDRVALELAEYFPLEEEEEKQPEPKQEEKEAQEEAEQEEEEREKQKELDETGVGSDPTDHGRVQIHDHTATVRRPSMRIARRAIPVAQGLGLRFAHRYFLDKAIFSQRLLTEAGIMIDGSGSMKWENQDMEFLLSKLPAVKIGVYSGLRYGHRNAKGEEMIGRICILAKDGRFAKFTSLDPEMTGNNVVDYEALQLLAKWPKPRLWLSDGLVCGGLHTGPSKKHAPVGWYAQDGKLHDLCDAWMKAHEILRVPNREVMHQLVRRQRVTLYRTSIGPIEEYRNGPLGISPHITWEHLFPSTVKPEPVTFQL